MCSARFAQARTAISLKDLVRDADPTRSWQLMAADPRPRSDHTSCPSTCAGVRRESRSSA